MLTRPVPGMIGGGHWVGTQATVIHLRRPTAHNLPGGLTLLHLNCMTRFFLGIYHYQPIVFLRRVTIHHLYTFATLANFDFASTLYL